MTLFVIGVGAICLIAGVFIGVIIYAVADGCFDIDFSRPHDDFD